MAAHDPTDPPLPGTYLLPAYRHNRSGAIHIRPDCRAMKYHRQHMTRVLLRADTERDELAKLHLCPYCFVEH